MAARKLGPGKAFSPLVSTRPIFARALSSFFFFFVLERLRKREATRGPGEQAIRNGHKLGVHMGGKERVSSRDSTPHVPLQILVAN